VNLETISTYGLICNQCKGKYYAMEYNDYPDLCIKIGIDEGENVIVQYGHEKSSLIDILGHCISITAKITSLTNPDKQA
jgi:class 3 adenylate cyclase